MKKGEIRLNNMEFYGLHGVPDAERKIKQLFVISVSFEYDFTKAAQVDNLNETINYKNVYNLCKTELQKQYKLIESIAYNIANSVKSNYPDVSNIKVSISKPQVQIEGKLESVQVEYYL